MGTCRFGLVNMLQTAPLLNGTVGGAPARVETAPFVMERAQNTDRRSLWKVPATTVQVDFDLGSPQMVTCAALLGLRVLGGSLVSANIGYYADDPYPGQDLELVGSLVMTDARDGGLVFDAPRGLPWRYWWIQITTTAQPFTVGRLWLGNLLDVGMHTPNATMPPFRNRLEQGQQDGSLLINELGDKGRDFQLPFTPIEAGTFAALESLSDQAGSLLYVDPNDRFYEIALRGGKVASGRDSQELFNASLDATRLP